MKQKTQKKYVYGQSGVQGFYGKTWLLEYWYQLPYKIIFPFWYKFDGIIFVTKTATLLKWLGNTKLRSGFKIKWPLPPSIWVSPKSFRYKYMLNAIGLSNPGAKAITERKELKERKGEHFHFSFESKSNAFEQEIEELDKILSQELPTDEYDYAIQMNESCPNIGQSTEIDSEKTEQITKKLMTFHRLRPETKIWVKFNATIDVKVLSALKPYCEGFVISNTIPFGAPCSVDWERWFKGGKSPLPKRLGKPFDGGFSGAPIFPEVVKKIAEIQFTDPTMNIIAGGGICYKRDIDILAAFSVVKGIAIGSIAVFRPYKVHSLIKYGNKVFARREKLFAKIEAANLNLAA